MCELSSLPRSQLSAHLEVCPNQPLPCPFSKAGCKAELKRRELKDHLHSQLQDHLTMVVEKLEMVETRNRNLEGLLAESEKKEQIREDRIAQLELRLMKLEEITTSGFDVISGSVGDTASGELNDWVTLDKKGHESPHMPEAVEVPMKQSKESESKSLMHSKCIPQCVVCSSFVLLMLCILLYKSCSHTCFTYMVTDV